MRGLLLRQERSRELFAREQGGLFEGALDEVGGCAVVWAVLRHCIGENDASPALRISGYMVIWLHGYLVVWYFDSILVYQCIDIVAQYLASMEDNRFQTKRVPILMLTYPQKSVLVRHVHAFFFSTFEGDDGGASQPSLPKRPANY